MPQNFNDKIAIAFVTPEFPGIGNKVSGGIGTSIYYAALGLQARGHHCKIVVYGQDKDAVFYQDQLEIHTLKNVRIKGLSMYFTQKKIQHYLQKLIDKKQIQAVEIPDWTGIGAFIRLKKAPLVVRLNGSDTFFCHLEGRKVKLKNRFLEKRTLQNATAHIAVSTFVAQNTNRIFGQNKPYTIIPNAINQKALDNSAKTPTNPLQLLYFGTLIRKKGVLDLAHIFNIIVEENPTIELVIIGKDSSDALTNHHSTWQIMQTIFTEKAQKKVRYQGAMSHANTMKAVQEAAVCVFPSYAEAFPLAWLEAMYLQKAIVASNIGWATEMITDTQDGFLVHPTQHRLFANRILHLINRPDINEQIGQAAHKTCQQKFSTDTIAAANEQFYKEIIFQS